MEKEIIRQLKLLRADILTLTRVMIDVKIELSELDKVEDYEGYIDNQRILITDSVFVSDSV